MQERNRAISWWIGWEDLNWPDQDVADTIRRRADTAAQSGVNLAMIFGAHCRWDFMPLWGRLHELFHFIAQALHDRGIRFFDHHSSCIVERPRDREGQWELWRRNRHHLLFYPSLKEARAQRYGDQLMDEWRMLDVGTGEPIYLRQYSAEQFCINNPGFRSAYRSYVERLVREAGIDGLMSDDGIFYAGWRACGCRWCREGFASRFGHELPPTDDGGFWHNVSNEAFKDWIDFRYQSVSGYLGWIRDSLPPGFPLMSCCSSSDSWQAAAHALSYQEFIKAGNMVMLEMCGSTPALTGRWDSHISSQLLHEGIAREAAVSCFGAGYGFFRDTAFFIWALNKFLGTDSWFSTLKGRLTLPDSRLRFLRSDEELVAEGYRWEKAHPSLFGGAPDCEVGVLFSRSTRDYASSSDAEYVADYRATCNALMRGGVMFSVLPSVPEHGGPRVLILSSITCLGAKEREALARFCRDGGSLVATGPFGSRDERGRPWTGEAVLGAAGCVGRLHVSAERVTQQGAEPALLELVRDLLERQRGGRERVWRVLGRPEGWYVRVFRDADRILVHGLPSQLGLRVHPELRGCFNSREDVIEALEYPAVRGELVVAFGAPTRAVTLWSPDLEQAREVPADRAPGAEVRVQLHGVRRYFVLLAVLEGGPSAV